MSELRPCMNNMCPHYCPPCRVGCAHYDASNIPERTSDCSCYQPEKPESVWEKAFNRIKNEIEHQSDLQNRTTRGKRADVRLVLRDLLRGMQQIEQEMKK